MSYLTSLIMKKAEEEDAGLAKVRRSNYTSKKSVIRDAYNNGITSTDKLVDLLYRYEHEGKLIKRKHTYTLPEMKRIRKQVNTIVCWLAKNNQIEKEYMSFEQRRMRNKKEKVKESCTPEAFENLSVVKDEVWKSLDRYEEDMLDE